MAVKKHILQAVYEDEMLVFAIHSASEGYRLAYMLNKHLSLSLARKDTDVEIKKDQTVLNYPLFEYKDEENNNDFYLINNKCSITEITAFSTGRLFNPETEETTHYLIPEMKKTDYFFKINSESLDYFKAKFLSKIPFITLISTAYEVDFDSLKSKNNLIFN